MGQCDQTKNAAYWRRWADCTGSGGVAHIEAEAEIGIAMGFIGCLSRLGKELWSEFLDLVVELYCQFRVLLTCKRWIVVHEDMWRKQNSICDHRGRSITEKWVESELFLTLVQAWNSIGNSIMDALYINSGDMEIVNCQKPSLAWLGCKQSCPCWSSVQRLGYHCKW